MKLNLSLANVQVQKPSAGYGVVPTGTYTVKVAKTEVKDTKSGSALILGYEVLEGEHAGVLVRDFLNIVNPSEKAQTIALERLATVAWATNAPMKKGVLEDSEDLVNGEAFDIYVTEEQDGEYKNNRVKSIVCTRSLEEVKKEEPKKATAPWKK